jgi:hypothetical protein
MQMRASVAVAVAVAVAVTIAHGFSSWSDLQIVNFGMGN